MKRAFFLSPHLDDVAFSCSGVLVRLLRAGWACDLATVFTASVPEPRGFALACQLDKGLGPDVDYMRLRRAEDATFAERVGGAEVHHLPHAEAPHRGYGSAPALFGPVHTDDDVWRSVAGSLATLLAEIEPDLLVAPLGLGVHVDHRQTIRALHALQLDVPVAWYRDAPYVLREPHAPPAPEAPSGLRPLPVDVSVVLDSKLHAVAAYATQLGFQFGGEPGMRDALARFACEEARRCGGAGAVEVLMAAPHSPARALLDGLATRAAG